jgi:hypothetical protein
MQVEAVWNYTKLAGGTHNGLGSVAIDSEGNIWVLGRFEDTSSRGQLILSKLDIQGNELWTTNFADGSYLWQPQLALAPSGGCAFGASSTNGNTRNEVSGDKCSTSQMKECMIHFQASVFSVFSVVGPSLQT